MYNMARSLHNAGAQVKILALNTSKHFIDPKSLPESFISWSGIEAVELDTSLKVSKALMNIFQSGSYNIERFYSEEFDELLKKELKTVSYEIVQLETSFFAPYIKSIRECSAAKIVMRTHNVEHVIWKRLAEEEKSFLKKTYLSFLSKRMKNVEVNALRKSDALVSLSSDDSSTFRELGIKTKQHYCPVGLDLNEYKTKQKFNDPLKLFHLGAMDWMPNIEAVEWLLEEVWPSIKKETNAELHIAGTGMSEEYFAMADDRLQVYGRIEDAKGFLAERDVMLVPVFSGSGIRVKILEGFAMGNAVISTSIGAEGIPVSNGHDIMIANNAKQFIDAVRSLSTDRSKLQQMSLNGRAAVQNNFSIDILGKKLISFYRSII